MTVKPPLSSIKELFSWSFTVFRENIKYLIPVALIFTLPVDFIINIIIYRMPHSLYEIALGIMNQEDINGLLLVGLVTLTLSPLLTAAVANIVISFDKGVKPSADTIMEASVGRILKLIATSLVRTLILIPAILLLVIPAVYFEFSFLFGETIVADNGKWGPSALAESRSLVRGRWFGVFLRIIIGNIAITIISNLLSILVYLILPDLYFAAELVLSAVGSILSAFAAVVTVNLYLELKNPKRETMEN